MALPPLHDTISAIATASGSGAIGIIRLSGPKTYLIAKKLFRPKKPKEVLSLKAGRVTYGEIFDETGIIDEALMLTFRAPHSYTAQDLIELQTHGGPAVLRRVLELSQQHGARLARAGEFTLRAFMNDRIDLIEAESVLAMVNAQSESARRTAAFGLNKALSQELQHIQSEITQVYGNLQAVFDYPEEGVEESAFQKPLERVSQRIHHLLSTARAGQIAQKGARLALVGKPNVGKSSLLNALLGYQRSIVSELPGTTRDYLEATLNIHGIAITAIDTAGIRQTEDAIEATGVSAAREIASHADLSLYLLDSKQAPSQEDKEFIANLDSERSLVVVNKADLGKTWQADLHRPLYEVSALTGEGLEALKIAISEKLLGHASSSELWISNERHVEALQQCLELLEQALHAPDDLAALDLEDALRKLSEITGRGHIAEETLEHIFANFCVGK